MSVKKKKSDEIENNNDIPESGESGPGEPGDMVTAGDKTADELEKLKQDIFDYRDKLVRKAAEFENYKKRTSEEFVRLINTASEDIISKLLPVLDDIDRFDKNYNEKTNATDLKKGIDLIHEKLRKVLKNSGLEEIVSINLPFDPEIHDALMITEVEGVDPNIVIDEHEKGYSLNGKVIRHAKVIVSK